VRKGLAGNRTATVNNGHATVCNEIADASQGPPVAHSATGCPQGRSWISEAAFQRSSGSACRTSGGGERTPARQAASLRDRSRPGNGLNPAVTIGQPG